MINPPRAIAIVLLTLLVAGCGQSGPLYIPGNPSTVQQPAQPEAAVEDEEDTESSTSP
jgi:predicted small lipoprotein YifL